MKKTMRILALLLCAVLLSGCCLKHEWEPADCEDPATCEKCGETLGDELDHHPGEWKTLRLPMWGQPGLKVRECLICGDTVDEETLTLEPSFCGETFHMDIHTMIERMETVMKGCSEQYDVLLAGHHDVNLSIYMKNGDEMIALCTFGVNDYYLKDDRDLPDEMELIGSMKYMDLSSDPEALALAFIACFDPTASRESAEALAAEIAAYVCDGSNEGIKTFSGTGIDIEVGVFDQMFIFSPEKKA